MSETKGGIAAARKLAEWIPAFALPVHSHFAYRKTRAGWAAASGG
jgi:hypothetical protein